MTYLQNREDASGKGGSLSYHQQSSTGKGGNNNLNPQQQDTSNPNSSIPNPHANSNATGTKYTDIYNNTSNQSESES